MKRKRTGVVIASIIIGFILVAGFLFKDNITYYLGDGNENREEAGYEYEGNVEGEKANDDYVPVEVEKVKRMTFVKESIFVGEIKSVKKIEVGSEITAKVVEKMVEIGDRVKKGDVLYALDRDTIEKEVDRLKKSYEQAQASYRLDSESYSYNNKDFERIKKLYSEGAISKKEYEESERRASMTKLDVSKAELNQAKSEYDRALKNVKKTTIISPINGIVGKCLFEKGEFIPNSGAVAVIIDIDNVYVEINVTENIINKLHKGKEIEVEIDAISDKELFKGTIETISPLADEKTKLYPVKVLIKNDKNLIKPGMFAKIRIPMKTREDSFAVKGQSVIKKDGKDVVYVSSGDKAQLKEVKTGLGKEEYIEILEGLKEEDLVIIKGQNYIKDGTTIKVVKGE